MYLKDILLLNCNYQLVTTDAQLQSVCEQAKKHARIALDTEFVRTRTYYPQLGLIQLFDGEQLSLIDPLEISQWQPLKALLVDPDVLKLIHAGSEDLEVFGNSFQCLPTPMIDTQVLAAFIGHPISCGFATLVAEYLHVELDKSESRTDWLARPLSRKQCEYAAADVYYLLPLADILLKKTEQAGYFDAAKDESDLIAQRRKEIVVPECAYKDIGNAWQLRPKQLACLKKLAAWRLNQARERDLAVNFVIREENLWQVARYMPTSLGELDALGLSGQEIRCHGRRLLAMVAESRNIPEEEYPAQVVNLIDYPDYRKVFKEIKSLITQVSEPHLFNAELLASRRQINQLLYWHWKLKALGHQPELLRGWRGELLDEPIFEILANYSEQ
ncbi:ribonuclease D [Xenorhabdus nematophila]|uniref:ribonuclease D n=1 Tax=Xenorhabdus nematophila TaxID=628 RepID=UPI0005424732|nr:ribonuclease D [Xenorhabdus nematophila]CEF31911.1 RNase D, processes tRNA precursor [Xenorhabdus nematophila str. Websteri]AYA40277.1 ribonuclease D [Xenorhabdus nematophila]KHD29062.1 ribonuclease D [Xenorhabdus nematophila]MBA0018946.1 ribonuclease D [Xenorhabdus nematophila]MCB4425187.1 ribonuclease D [Xenorhabdus nematophila]